MIFIKSFLTGVLYDCLKLIYAYLSEGNKFGECYSCPKIIIQAHLHASLKRFYLYIKLMQSSKTLKQKNSHEVSCD